MHGDAIQVNAVLVAPDPPATVIRRLRGKVPVIAVARGSDPIVIPLKGEGVLGRPYSTRDLTLIVDEVSLAPGAPAWVKVTVRANRGDRATFARHDPPWPAFAAFNLGGVLEHLELHDAAGRRLNHHLGSQTRSRSHGDRYQLIVSPVSEDGPGAGPGTSKTPIPSELRYYRFVREGDGNPLRFPRHPHALNRAGVLPMSIAPLVLFAAMAAAPAAGPDPTALVAKLGSAEPAERAAAAESLKALGREALPALQEAMKAGDANVRERASALWETIQRDLMTRPSLVRLDGRDRPLAVVLEDLETQTGLTLQRDQSGPRTARGSPRAGPGPVLDGARAARVVGHLLSKPGRRQVPDAPPPRSPRAGVHLDRRPVPGLP